jgi:hypothetical protein
VAELERDLATAQQCNKKLWDRVDKAEKQLRDWEPRFVLRDNPEHYEKWKAAERELKVVTESRDLWVREAYEARELRDKYKHEEGIRTIELDGVRRKLEDMTKARDLALDMKQDKNASEAMARISTICNQYKGWR